MTVPQVPDGVDVNVPNAARIYDYFLGGSHNWAPDREAAQRILASAPPAQVMARINRGYLGRVVRFLATTAGMRQFLDLGSGIPTVGNVHEIAQGVDPQIRVAYVDFEAVAVAHSAFLLTGNPCATVVQADITAPRAVLDDPTVRGLIDFTEPVALLMVSVLPFVPSAAGPARLVAEYVGALAPGSHLAISHASLDGVDQELLARAMRAKTVYDDTSTPVTPRSRAEIASWFTGLDLVPPGIVNIAEWRPDSDSDLHDTSPIPSFGGVGRVMIR